MNRQDLLLAVLAAAEGQAYQPVQLQKALFLLSQNIPEVVCDGPGFGFVPYDYGPFDSDVYAEAQRLKAAGLAEIGPSTQGRWSAYSASHDGVTRGREVLGRLTPAQREYIEEVSSWVRRLSFAALVKSIYEAYPEQRANSIFQG